MRYECIKIFCKKDISQNTKRNTSEIEKHEQICNVDRKKKRLKCTMWLRLPRKGMKIKRLAQKWQIITQASQQKVFIRNNSKHHPRQYIITGNHTPTFQRLLNTSSISDSNDATS